MLFREIEIFQLGDEFSKGWECIRFLHLSEHVQDTAHVQRHGVIGFDSHEAFNSFSIEVRPFEKERNHLAILKTTVESRPLVVKRRRDKNGDVRDNVERFGE